MSIKILFLLFTIVVLHKCSSYSYCDYDINVCFLTNEAYSTNLIDARDICTGDGSILLEIYNQAYQDAIIEAFKRWGYDKKSTFCMLNLKYVNGVYKWQSNGTLATYANWNKTQSAYTESTFFISLSDPFNWYTDTDISFQRFFPVVCMQVPPTTTLQLTSKNPIPTTLTIPRTKTSTTTETSTSNLSTESLFTNLLTTTSTLSNRSHDEPSHNGTIILKTTQSNEDFSTTTPPPTIIWVIAGIASGFLITVASSLVCLFLIRHRRIKQKKTEHKLKQNREPMPLNSEISILGNDSTTDANSTTYDQLSPMSDSVYDEMPSELESSFQQTAENTQIVNQEVLLESCANARNVGITGYGKRNNFLQDFSQAENLLMNSETQRIPALGLIPYDNRVSMSNSIDQDYATSNAISTAYSELNLRYFPESIYTGMARVYENNVEEEPENRQVVNQERTSQLYNNVQNVEITGHGKKDVFPHDYTELINEKETEATIETNISRENIQVENVSSVIFNTPLGPLSEGGFLSSPNLPYATTIPPINDFSCPPLEMSIQRQYDNPTGCLRSTPCGDNQNKPPSEKPYVNAIPHSKTTSTPSEDNQNEPSSDKHYVNANPQSHTRSIPSKNNQDKLSLDKHYANESQHCITSRNRDIERGHVNPLKK